MLQNPYTASWITSVLICPYVQSTICLVQSIYQRLCEVTFIYGLNTKVKLILISNNCLPNFLTNFLPFYISAALPICTSYLPPIYEFPLHPHSLSIYHTISSHNLASSLPQLSWQSVWFSNWKVLGIFLAASHPDIGLTGFFLSYFRHMP